jgi:TPR repeat protein
MRFTLLTIWRTGLRAVPAAWLVVAVLAGAAVAEPTGERLKYATAAFDGSTGEVLAALLRGDYATARRITQSLADKGDPVAQWRLGRMHYYGLGVPEEWGEAVRWYRKAAEQGHANAQYDLVFMYRWGWDRIKADRFESLKWLRKAADQGLPDAQGDLGEMYRFGEGGDGVLQNYAEALKWFRKAAEQGEARAQWRLGGMYYGGTGVPKNYVLAHMWYNLAGTSPSSRPDSYAIEARKDVAEKMTSAQIAKAQSMAEQCLRSNYVDCGWP